MTAILKVIVAVIIIAIAANQLHMYYNIVILGSYVTTAPIHLVIITGILWPILVLLLASWLLKLVYKFDYKKFAA